MDIFNSRITFLCIVALLVACGQNNEQVRKGSPDIKFEKTEFDFGTILMGEKVSHRFNFMNVGQGDLYIQKVISDCGCTVVDFEKKAIPPGKESYIEALFDSGGMPGLQIKNLFVYANVSDSVITLTLSASVDYSLEQNF